VVLRTYYENNATLKNESKFKERIMAAWDCDLKKMHYHHIIDFMLTRNRVAKAWVEVKCLNKTRNQYPYTILSLSKFMKGVEYYNVTGLPFIFATRLKDEDMYYRYNPEHPKFEIIWGGRTKQTRDKYDIEPVIQIPMVFFKEI
tara:strand:+ start:313 stop:744 length:432 start_codon:yes stop_codon:yes gene_type:complete